MRNTHINSYQLETSEFVEFIEEYMEESFKEEEAHRTSYNFYLSALKALTQQVDI